MAGPGIWIPVLLVALLAINGAYGDKFLGIGWCMNKDNERPPYWGQYSERSLNRCLDACAETDTCVAVAYRKNDKYCTLHMDPDENPGEDWSGPFNEEYALNYNHTETNAIVIECWMPDPPGRKRKRRARKKRKQRKHDNDEEFESAVPDGEGPPEEEDKPKEKAAQDPNRIVLERPKRTKKDKKAKEGENAEAAPTDAAAPAATETATEAPATEQAPAEAPAAAAPAAGHGDEL